MPGVAPDFINAALRGTCAVGVLKNTPWVYGGGTTSDRNREVALQNGDLRYVAIQGSGFFLDAATGMLLTAEHVRRDCRKACHSHASTSAKLVICPYLGGELDWTHAWEAEVVAHTGNWDLNDPEVPEQGLAAGMVLTDHVDAAVLRPTRDLITGKPVATPVSIPSTGETITALRISTSPLETNQVLHALGFPTAGGKMTPTPIEGNYSLDDTAPGKATGTFLKFTGAEILPGHSGGPIVTSSGVCVAWTVPAPLPQT